MLLRKAKSSGGKISGELVFVFAAISVPFVALVVNSITAAFVSPKEFGVFQSILLIQNYTGWLSFGVFSGLSRNLAINIGKGDSGAAQSAIDGSARIARVLSSVGLVIGVIATATLAMAEKTDTTAIGAALLLALSLALSPLTTHLEATYRSGSEFARLGWSTFAIQLFYCGASALIVAFGYIGRLGADALRVVMSFAFRFYMRPWPTRGEGSLSTIKELAVVGLPIQAGGYLWGILLVADQSTIAIWLGPSALGDYTIARLFAAALFALPAALNQVLYPSACKLYGRTGIASALRPFYWKALCISIIVVVPISILGFFLVEPVTTMFFPAYAAGISSAKISALSGVCLACMGPSVIFGTLRRNKSLIVATSMALLSFWLVAWLCAEHLSLEFVATLKFVILAILSIYVAAHAYFLTRNEPH